MKRGRNKHDNTLLRKKFMKMLIVGNVEKKRKEDYMMNSEEKNLYMILDL